MAHASKQCRIRFVVILSCHFPVDILRFRVEL
jgi:hypothetical protein